MNARPQKQVMEALKPITVKLNFFKFISSHQVDYSNHDDKSTNLRSKRQNQRSPSI